MSNEPRRKSMIDTGLQPDLPFERPTTIALLTASEIYDTASAFLLYELKEDRRLERKPAGVHAELLGEYFSMWANAPPEGGIIAVGVENNGRISGCLNTGIEHINSLEASGRYFCPQAHYDVKRVNVVRDDGQRDYVLLFRVYFRSGKKVIRTVKNKAYIRLGGSKHALNEYEIREIEIDTGEIAFEQELADYVYPNDFRKDLIAQYVENFKAEREGRLDENTTTEEILELMQLGRFGRGRKFLPNLACVLVFAKRPQRRFPVARFDFCGSRAK